MKKLIIPLIAALVLASCGGASDDEIISALKEISDDAYELNLIIYGDGIPHEQTVNENGYYKVSEEAKYGSIAELREAMSEVFTPEYIEIIENTAFLGVSTDEGRVEAKFTESEGALYVNPDVTADFGEPLLINTEKAEIKKKNSHAAIVTIPHEGENIEITMRKVDGKWLIDSPIF